MVVSVAEWDELQETIAVLTDPEARTDLSGRNPPRSISLTLAGLTVLVLAMALTLLGLDASLITAGKLGLEVVLALAAVLCAGSVLDPAGPLLIPRSPSATRECR
jgi:hypothetical protein